MPKPLLTTTRLLAVFFVQLNETYQLSVLLPIVVFMCRDFGIPAQWLGVYSSILNASFSFSQFCVCYMWGRLSDVYGRRSILLCGLFGTCVAMIVFGFSTSFEMALIARCFSGVFNGNQPVLKAYLADITDSSNRGYAFTIIGVSWGAGGILGSIVGGILIDTNDVDAPDDLYIPTTSILKWSIFEHKYPYILPISICGGLISVNALAWALLFIKDIKPTTKTSTHSNDALDIASDIEMASNLTAPITTTLAYTASTATQLPHNTNYDYSLEHIAIHHSLPSHHEIKEMISSLDPAADKLHLLSTKRQFTSLDESSEIDELSSVWELLKYTKLSHTLLQFAVIVITWFMFKEMGPVFMAQALDFNSAYIGYTQAWSGIVYFVWCLMIQPTVLRKFQHNMLMLICVSMAIIAAILMPSTYWFTLITHQKLNFMNDELWLLCMVFVAELVFTTSVGVIFTVSTCWINNSVPAMHVGKANGIAQTVAALVKAIGPLITGFIWSESIVRMEDGAHYAVYLAYLPIVVMSLIAIVDIVAYIPTYLQYTSEEQENMKNQKT